MFLSSPMAVIIMVNSTAVLQHLLSKVLLLYLNQLMIFFCDCDQVAEMQNIVICVNIYIIFYK